MFAGKLDMEFRVFKDSNDKVIGFLLRARPHTESELFCYGFPRALLNGKAKIYVEGEHLVFFHKVYDGNQQVKYHASVSAGELKAIRHLLEEDKTENNLELQDATIMTPGFQVVLAGTQIVSEMT